MTAEEIEIRGISIFTFQYSLLYITGNCLNNNTEVYCVILGHSPPPSGGNTTSSTALLTVQG